MLTKEELALFLNNPEENRIKKTASITDKDKFGAAICAFTNDFPATKQPGYLILGVNDDGSRCGLEQDELILQFNII